MRLFYSYAHEDAGHRGELEKHLASLRREGLVSAWSDREIAPGQEWRNEILGELERADLILFLVSADFLNSDFIWDVEMKRALERHAEGRAVVVPVIVRPADWQRSAMGALQAVPREGRPVTEWENRDAAWVNVVAGIRDLAERKSQGVPVAAQGGGGGLTTRMRVSRGEALLWVGRAQEGAAMLDAAIAEAPADEDSFLMRARALMVRSRGVEALEAFNAVLAREPNQVEALIGRALTQAGLNRLPAAQADVNRAIELSDRIPYAYYVRGLVKERMGEEQKAKKDFDRALALDPKHVLALAARGLLQYRQGEHDRALSDFSQAVALSPDMVGAIVGRGWSYAKLKRYDEATAEFQRALQLEPNNVVAVNGLEEVQRLAQGKGMLKKLFG